MSIRNIAFARNLSGRYQFCSIAANQQGKRPRSHLNKLELDVFFDSRGTGDENNVKCNVKR
jgi:hypothetical protein